MSELQFDHDVRSIGSELYSRSFFPTARSFCFQVCLQDSVLAFHDHGMQGRSLKENEMIQEIDDQTRFFRVIGADRYGALAGVFRLFSTRPAFLD